MKAQAHVMGTSVDLSNIINDHEFISLEIELDDGRTVKIRVNNDGGIDVQGWSSRQAQVETSHPARIGPCASPAVRFRCQLLYEDPTPCATCRERPWDCICGD